MIACTCSKKYNPEIGRSFLCWESWRIGNEREENFKHTMRDYFEVQDRDMLVLVTGREVAVMKYPGD